MHLWEVRRLREKISYSEEKEVEILRQETAFFSTQFRHALRVQVCMCSCVCVCEYVRARTRAFLSVCLCQEDQDSLEQPVRLRTWGNTTFFSEQEHEWLTTGP